MESRLGASHILPLNEAVLSSETPRPETDDVHVKKCCVSVVPLDACQCRSVDALDTEPAVWTQQHKTHPVRTAFVCADLQCANRLQIMAVKREILRRDAAHDASHVNTT